MVVRIVRKRLTKCNYLWYNRVRDIYRDITMKKIVLALLILLVLMPISCEKTIQANEANQDIQFYIGWGNLLTEKLPKTHEVMIFMFDRFNYIECTNLIEGEVRISDEVLGKEMAKLGVTLADALIIIHNHPFGLCRFSPPDTMAYYKFKAMGFRGAYMLYCNATNEWKMYQD